MTLLSSKKRVLYLCLMTFYVLPQRLHFSLSPLRMERVSHTLSLQNNWVLHVQDQKEDFGKYIFKGILHGYSLIALDVNDVISFTNTFVQAYTVL
jgi:hypothetical protein